MKRIILIILSAALLATLATSQVQVTRKKKQQTTQQQTQSKPTKPSTTQSKPKPTPSKPLPPKKQISTSISESTVTVSEPIVTISDPTGYINGQGYVDLGLPSGLKWATCNIGASSPGDYGNYYAWGETTTKSTYTDSNSLIYGKSKSELQSAGIINPYGNLTLSHDAARANWGGTWRMPTKKEQEELKARCTWTWTSYDGNTGYKVTGPNGRSIFVPAAGFRFGSSLDLASKFGNYWGASGSRGSYAYCFYFYSDTRGVDWRSISYGRSVRPVSE